MDPNSSIIQDQYLVNENNQHKCIIQCKSTITKQKNTQFHVNIYVRSSSSSSLAFSFSFTLNSRVVFHASCTAGNSVYIRKLQVLHKKKKTVNIRNWQVNENHKVISNLEARNVRVLVQPSNVNVSCLVNDSRFLPSLSRFFFLSNNNISNYKMLNKQVLLRNSKAWEEYTSGVMLSNSLTTSVNFATSSSSIEAAISCAKKRKGSLKINVNKRQQCLILISAICNTL